MAKPALKLEMHALALSLKIRSFFKVKVNGLLLTHVVAYQCLLSAEEGAAWFWNRVSCSECQYERPVTLTQEYGTYFIAFALTERM